MKFCLYLHVFIEKLVKGNSVTQTLTCVVLNFLLTQFFMFMVMLKRLGLLSSRPFAIGYVEHARVHKRGVQIVLCAIRIQECEQQLPEGHGDAFYVVFRKISLVKKNILNEIGITVVQRRMLIPLATFEIL